jgi:hypothetical protein
LRTATLETTATILLFLATIRQQPVLTPRRRRSLK